MIEELSRSIQLQVQPTSLKGKTNNQGVNPIFKQPTSAVLTESRDQQRQSQKPIPPPTQSNFRGKSICKERSQEETSPITSSKKVKLKKLMGKLNKSLEDFFLKDGPEEISYVDDFSMLNHYDR